LRVIAEAYEFTGFGEINLWFVKLNQIAKKKGRIMNVTINAKAGSAKPQPETLDCVKLVLFAIL
jgi:hypothetical protein